MEATTKVMINGFLSSPFIMTRGVQQGNPLSCLIFDLTIELLAEGLRSTQNEGLKIPGQNESIKVRLFADDTTVYLAQNDNLEELRNILSDWCIAARAKFNVTKTEVIPIGSETYWNQVLTTRKMKNDGDEIPGEYHII